MILRKPYAFLIKYFQKINLILLLLVGFIFYKTIQVHSFVKSYLDTTVYNEKLDSVSNYCNIYVFGAFVLAILVSLILTILLKRKDKPFFSYAFIAGVNVPVLALFIYIRSFFVYRALDTFDLVTARVLTDLSLIASIPYYIIVFILLIRSIGLDLKSFGFQEDKEFLEINEADREEVEVEVGFDKHKWLRKIRYFIRNAKYFYLEHKVPLLLVTVFVIGIGVYQFYQYFYVEHRIYKTNESLVSNDYRLKVKNTYLTDKDYSGKVVAEEGRTFILVDLEVTNLLTRERNFDIQKVLLYINNDFYVPTSRFNSYFKDMGNLYKGVALKSKEKTSYLLIYEIDKPTNNEDVNFILKYQDVKNSSKLIQIKIGVKDLSKFKEKGTKTIPEEFSIQLNEEDTITFSLSKLNISKTIDYTYQSCKEDGTCPIYKKTLEAASHKRILSFNFYAEQNTKQEFMDFLKNYGKVRYVLDGQEKIIDINNAVKSDYKGNHVYLTVPSEIEQASSVDLVFTVRVYKYIYHLKGE